MEHSAIEAPVAPEAPANAPEDHIVEVLPQEPAANNPPDADAPLGDGPDNPPADQQGPGDQDGAPDLEDPPARDDNDQVDADAAPAPEAGADAGEDKGESGMSMKTIVLIALLALAVIGGCFCLYPKRASITTCFRKNSAADDQRPRSNSQGSDATSMNDPERAPLQIGDKVRLKAGVKLPRYGWGEIHPDWVGVITGIPDLDAVVIDFPLGKGWKADPTQLDLIERRESMAQIHVGSSLNPDPSPAPSKRGEPNVGNKPGGSPSQSGFVAPAAQSGDEPEADRCPKEFEYGYCGCGKSGCPKNLDLSL